MKLVQAVLNVIKKYELFCANEKIIAGVSGGPDSIALLHILCLIRDKFPFTIWAAHFNHGTRGEESDKDEQFVLEFCSKLNIPFYTTKRDEWKDADLSREEKYRFARYEWFLTLAQKLNASKIAIAHNSDDQAETVVMRFIKGSVAGLSGIKIKRPISQDYPDIQIIRPLLYISKAEILDYCETFKLNPRIDASNMSMEFDRNRIRHVILPAMKKENPNFNETISRNIDVISQEDSYLTEVCDAIFNSIGSRNDRQEIVLNKKKFSEQHIAIQRRLIRMSWKKISCSQYNIYSDHVENIIRIIHSQQGTNTFSLPCGVFFFTEGNNLIFSNQSHSSISSFEYPFTNVPELYIKELNCMVKMENLGYSNPELSNTIVYFDRDRLPSPLCWRNYRQDDCIIPFGMNKEMKLSKFFSNAKIPHYKRNNYLLLACEDKVLWVAGLRRGTDAIVTPESKNILKLVNQPL